MDHAEVSGGDTVRRDAKRDWLNISEVAKLYGVTEHQLRHWDDDLGILVPRRRGSARIYRRPELERLAQILGWRQQGWKPSKIKTWLEFQGKLSPGSRPTTYGLEESIRLARRGDVIRDGLPSKDDYNTGYQRMRRIIRRRHPTKRVGLGNDVEIRLSDDGRYLEARFVR